MRNVLRQFDRLMASHIWHLPRNAIALLITGYQHTLSPDHGPLRPLFRYGYCRHHPTCSQYAKDTILRRGVLIGVPLAAWRVLKCNPFTPVSDERILRTISGQDLP